MSDTQAWIDQSREIESKATDGPWGATWNGAREGSIGGDTDVLDATNVSAQELHFITEARTRLPQALAALQAVIDLHKPEEYDGYPHSPDGAMCAVCLTEYEEDEEWPCPTVRAITDAIGEHDD